MEAIVLWGIMAALLVLILICSCVGFSTNLLALEIILHISSSFERCSNTRVEMRMLWRGKKATRMIPQMRAGEQGVPTIIIDSFAYICYFAYVCIFVYQYVCIFVYLKVTRKTRMIPQTRAEECGALTFIIDSFYICISGYQYICIFVYVKATRKTRTIPQTRAQENKAL